MPDWGVLLGVLGEMPFLQVVLWAVAAGLFIGLVVKAWPFFKNAVQIVDALLKLPGIAEELPGLAEQVTQIHHETRKNDGSSLKDSVDRIEASLEGLHGRLDTVEKDVGGIRQETRHLHEADLEQRRVSRDNSKKIDDLDGKFDQHLAWSHEIVDRLEKGDIGGESKESESNKPSKEQDNAVD